MTRSAAALAGFAAAGLAFAVPILGGALRPGYSHVSQYISELGESGAQGGSAVSLLGFAPIGIAVIAFLALAAPQLPVSRRRTAALISLGFVGAAYLVSAVARCEPGCQSTGSTSQALHNLFGLLEYLGAIAGLALLYFELRGSPRWRSLAPATGLAALLVAAGLLAMLNPSLVHVRGVSQRIADGAIFLWIAWVSVSLLRAEPASH